MSAPTHSDETRGALLRFNTEREIYGPEVAFISACSPLLRALEDISTKALRAKNHGSMADALLAINETAQAALQRPLEGTRVRCLMPHRGEYGTVTGWDRDLGVALVTWDDLSGLPPEGVEPGEYEVIA